MYNKLFIIIIVIIIIIIIFKNKIIPFILKIFFKLLRYDNKEPYLYNYKYKDINIPSKLKNEFYKIYYKRCEKGDRYLNKNEMKDIITKMTNYVEKNCKFSKPESIPIIKMNEIHKYIYKHHPFIIKNGHNLKMKLDDLISKYGDTTVLFLNKKSNDLYKDKLHTIQKTKDYITNSNSFLRKHPELLKGLDKEFR